MKIKFISKLAIGISCALLAVCSTSVVFAAPKYKADVPSSILTPDKVETRLGTLRFKDGAPDAKTAELVYDNLDFMRGVEAFLDGIPAASIYAIAQGFREAGMGQQSIGIFEDLMDARSIFLTPNSTTVYISKVFADALPAEVVGTLAAIGIKKGQPFEPDARMKAILEEAVAVGNATSRAIIFAQRDKRGFYFPDRQWKTSFIGGSSEFEDNGERLKDARVLFHYYATVITPAMAIPKVGTGSVYAYAERDAKGDYLDGGKTYSITLPAPIPVNNFWSFMVYDNQTRSMLETDQKASGLDSNSPDIKPNADGSYTVYFGPEAPKGKEGNWVQTMPGKGWNTLLRLYGPLEPWFEKTWKPGDFELVK